jgi:endonuclease/exonuclease/phosphatase family metal-dependent hydrolase
MKTNSMDVQQMAAFDKVKVMQTHINTIEAERKRQERTIRKLKTIEESAATTTSEVQPFGGDEDRDE